MDANTELAKIKAIKVYTILQQEIFGGAWESKTKNIALSTFTDAMMTQPIAAYHRFNAEVQWRGGGGAGGGAEPPLLKFPFNQEGLSPFRISAERDIILLNKTNFLQDCDCFTYIVQFLKFIAI